MKRVCKNPKCAAPLSRHLKNFCPSCRYLARWVFAATAGAAGIVTGILKALGWL